jgi:hypothetical protein
MIAKGFPVRIDKVGASLGRVRSIRDEKAVSASQFGAVHCTISDLFFLARRSAPTPWRDRALISSISSIEQTRAHGNDVLHARHANCAIAAGEFDRAR